MRKGALAACQRTPVLTGRGVTTRHQKAYVERACAPKHMSSKLVFRRQANCAPGRTAAFDPESCPTILTEGAPVSDRLSPERRLDGQKAFLGQLLLNDKPQEKIY